MITTGTRVKLARPIGSYVMGAKGTVKAVHVAPYTTWPYTIQMDGGDILFCKRNELTELEPVVEEIPGQLELPFEAAVDRVYEESKALLLKKHHDYGPRNIADAPGGPLNGLAVRLYDKVSRLSNLLEKGAEPENESLADTFRDIANYGHIGELVLSGDWPGAGGSNG